MGCWLDRGPPWTEMAASGLVFAAYAPVLVRLAGGTWSGVAATAISGVTFPLWFYALAMASAGMGAKGWPMPPDFATATFFSTIAIAAVLARATRRPLPIVTCAVVALFGAALGSGCVPIVGAPFAWNVAMFIGLCAAGPRTPQLPITNGRCTACGYSVEGLPDSISICPECGARIRSPDPLP